MGFDLRQEILAAAEVVFGQQGYKDTKVADIAAQAGVATGTIYCYFKSKEELFETICRPELKNIIPSAEKRRIEILEAALDIFGQKGFARASMEDIAGRLGLSKGVIYQHFKNKEELFVATVKETTEMQKLGELAAGTIDFMTLEEGLTCIARGFLAFYQDDRRANLLRAVIAETPSFPEVGQLFYQEIINKITGFLAEYLGRHLPGSYNHHLAARIFQGALTSFIISQQLIQVEGDKYEDEVIVKEVVGIFLKGMENKL